MDHGAFTQEEIGEYAIGNAEGLWLATVLYLKSKGLSVEEWVEYVGNAYAPGWEASKGKGGLAVMRNAALNWVSCGATLVSMTGDDLRAEAVLIWPPEDYPAFPIQDAQKIANIFFPIAHYVGLQYSWQSEGKQVRLSFFK